MRPAAFRQSAKLIPTRSLPSVPPSRSYASPKLEDIKKEKLQQIQARMVKQPEYAGTPLFTRVKDQILQHHYAEILKADPTLKYRKPIFREEEDWKGKKRYNVNVPDHIVLQKTSLRMKNDWHNWKREEALADTLSHMSKGDVIRHSLQKHNLLARQIKGLTVTEALRQMTFSLKKPAKTTIDLLNKAVDESEKKRDKERWDFVLEQYGVTKDDKEYVISQAWVEKVMTLKGVRMHGKGMAGRVTSDLTRIVVILHPRVISHEVLCIRPNRANMVAMPKLRHDLDIREEVQKAARDPPLRDRFAKFFFN